MKLLRYGKQGEEKPGILDTNGNLRSIAELLSDYTAATLTNDFLDNLFKTISISNLPLIDKNIRLGACINAPGKIICIGYNSRLHTKQMGVKPLPKTDMLVFMKPSCCICGPYDPILYTRYTKKLDWEAELGVVIGKKGKYIPKSAAKNYILGYLCINDLSERYLQLETPDKQYTKGKSFDNAAPIGPYLVTKDEIDNSSALQIQLLVNGVLRQNFNTKNYIHNDEEVISYLSKYFTLYPGDIISMGSAPGSAAFWGENMFLKPNDKVICSITGLGQQEQLVILET